MLDLDVSMSISESLQLMLSGELKQYCRINQSLSRQHNFSALFDVLVIHLRCDQFDKHTNKGMRKLWDRVRPDKILTSGSNQC